VEFIDSRLRNLGFFWGGVVVLKDHTCTAGFPRLEIVLGLGFEILGVWGGGGQDNGDALSIVRKKAKIPQNCGGNYWGSTHRRPEAGLNPKP
jgi:hypothetical protein